jgi:hypothetical protein
LSRIRTYEPFGAVLQTVTFSHLAINPLLNCFGIYWFPIAANFLLCVFFCKPTSAQVKQTNSSSTMSK